LVARTGGPFDTIQPPPFCLANRALRQSVVIVVAAVEGEKELASRFQKNLLITTTTAAHETAVVLQIIENNNVLIFHVIKATQT